LLPGEDILPSKNLHPNFGRDLRKTDFPGRPKRPRVTPGFPVNRDRKNVCVYPKLRGSGKDVLGERFWGRERTAFRVIPLGLFFPIFFGRIFFWGRGLVRFESRQPDKDKRSTKRADQMRDVHQRDR